VFTVLTAETSLPPLQAGWISCVIRDMIMTAFDGWIKITLLLLQLLEVPSLRVSHLGASVVKSPPIVKN